jgi:ubiquinone/menaquinone biosynthesis C-methylase UbiE
MSNPPEPPSRRTLDNEIPELKPYLFPGAKVLDVGCGPGTITLDVADVVRPGEIIGITPSQEQVDTAREWAAEVGSPANVTYQVGDSHRLAFPDNTFDVVYSHTVAHFFLDPVRALQEQKRVAKKGGWVIASGVRDWPILYPHCPHWIERYTAQRRYWVSNLAEYQDSHSDPVEFLEEQIGRDPGYLYYYDMHAGRKCPEWFCEAGLQDVRVQVQPRRIQYQGSDNMHPSVFDLLVLGEPGTSGEKLLATLEERVIARGLLDEETLERAKDEARAWYENPGAFRFQPEIFAAGQA